MENRAANVDDEISRFFKETEPPLLVRHANVSHHRVQPSALRNSSSSLRGELQQSCTASSSMPTPSPNFLGFGIPGRRPNLSIRIRSKERSSISPSKYQLYQSPGPSARSGTPLPWSTSPNMPSASSRPRIPIGSMSMPSRRLEGRRNRHSSTVNERSPIRARGSGSPSGQQPLRQQRDTGTSDSASQSAESAQGVLNSQSSDRVYATKDQQLNKPGSRPVIDHEWHPAVIDTRSNAEQPQVEVSESSPSTLACETQKDSAHQPATADEEGSIEPAVVDEMRTDHEGAHEVTQAEVPVTLKNQFAADLNELLGKWRGKIAIPDEFSRSIQMSPTNGPATENRVLQERDHSVETAVQDAIGDSGGPQETRAPAHSPRPTTNETLCTRTHVPCERSRVPARISMVRSQRSWTDLRVRDNYGYHLDARSPFQDSTYSTCRTGSIYEQQMQELPLDRQFDRRLHGHNEPPHLANTRMTPHPVSSHRSIEPPYLPLQHQPSTLGYHDGQAMQKAVRYPVFNAPAPLSGIIESSGLDRGRSVGALGYSGTWFSPARSFVQVESQSVPALHYSSPMRHFPDHVFGDKAMNEDEPGFASGESEHSEQALDAADVVRTGADESLEGFWKPNLLY